MTDTPADVTIDVGVPSEQPARHVIEAISRVMRDLPAIAKDSEGAGVPYKFRGIEAIVAHTKALMARHGVVLVPFAEEWDLREITVANKPWTDDRIMVTYRAYGPSGLDDYVTLRIPAIGRDNSDKGSNKAMTQAYKYAMLQLFNIGDAASDPDAERHETDPARPIEERGDVTIPRNFAESYMRKAGVSGLNVDQIQAIVHKVTKGRTDQPALVLQSEWDELNEQTKTAVDARRATQGPRPPQSEIDRQLAEADAPTGAGVALGAAVAPQERREGPEATETAPEPSQGVLAPVADPPPEDTSGDVPRETTPSEAEAAVVERILAEAKKTDLTVIRAFLVSRKQSVQGNMATIRSRYTQIRCQEELGFDPFKGKTEGS